MTGINLTINATTFFLAFWLGCYLIGRDTRNPVLRLAGLGCIAYALAMTTFDLSLFIGRYTMVRSWVREAVLSLRGVFQVFVALFWAGALIETLPRDTVAGKWLRVGWRFGLLPLVMFAAPTLATLGLLADFQRIPPLPRNWPPYLWPSVWVLVALFVSGGAVWQEARRAGRRIDTLLVVATLFFALSSASLFIPVAWYLEWWVRDLIGIDVLTLGVVIAARDAFDQGETVRADMARSFVLSAVVAALFGGLVGAAMVLVRVAYEAQTPAAGPLVGLLYAVVGLAIVLTVLADALAGFVDAVALRRLPGVRHTRAELRAVASALPRADLALDPEALDAAAFDRLTRRALGDFGDLPRLAASPLTRLALIDTRLAARGAPDDPLERAAELKSLLAERVARLKPRIGGDFGTSAEWRHYNALYFPYIVGLTPYRARPMDAPADPAAHAALDWFRASVPERTLHNWQNAAARLVAQDLREGNRQSPVVSGQRETAPRSTLMTDD